MNLAKEYEVLLGRFNNAFNYKYDENSKADIEFRKIIKRLAKRKSRAKK